MGHLQFVLFAAELSGIVTLGLDGSCEIQSVLTRDIHPQAPSAVLAASVSFWSEETFEELAVWDYLGTFYVSPLSEGGYVYERGFRKLGGAVELLAHFAGFDDLPCGFMEELRAVANGEHLDRGNLHFGYDFDEAA